MTRRRRRKTIDNASRDESPRRLQTGDTPWSLPGSDRYISIARLFALNGLAADYARRLFSARDRGISGARARFDIHDDFVCARPLIGSQCASRSRFETINRI